MSTSPAPHLSFTLEASREPKLLLEQLAEGLLNGGLLGPDLAIEGRDAESLRFVRRGGVWHQPDRGELHVAKAGSGAKVEVRLWCGGLRRRCFARATVIAALAATITTFAFGWLIVLTAPGAGVLAVATDLLSWQTTKKGLRRRVETYVSNTAYLRAL